MEYVNDSDGLPHLLLVVPDAIAQALIDEGLANYHFQSTRDSSLVPMLIVAATSSAVTVATKDLTAGLFQSLARALVAWRSRHEDSSHDSSDSIDVSIEVTSSRRLNLSVESSTKVPELAEAIASALSRLQVDALESDGARDTRSPIENGATE